MNDRKEFDAALSAYTAGDRGRALALFANVTKSSPTMADAWLGRIACGDHSLDVLAAAHTNSRMLHKETNRWQWPPGYLRGELDTPRYIKLPVWNRATAAMGYAVALIGAARFDDAQTVLDDPVITADSDARQWRQLLSAALFHVTGRWPDVRTVTAVSPPPGATSVQPQLTGAVDTLGAWAAVHLGQPDTALTLLDRVTVAPQDNPYIVADGWAVRGWCLRAKGDQAARAAFEAAVADGHIIGTAADALAHPDWQLTVTSAEQIATRTDRWDPATETTQAQRARTELDGQRKEALTRAGALLGGLIGLQQQKEEIEVWRTEIQLDRITGGGGGKENHMVFAGPPGTAKTTFARIAAEILFGLGVTDRPDPTEVTEEDLVVGYVSQTPQKMKEVCEDALGGVLFIDEAYRLTARPDGHSFGKQAVDVLLKYMEDYRDKLVVIAAGYPKEMQQFLAANPGLRSRFNYTLTFGSYTPGEVVQIGQRLAEKQNIRVCAEAWPLLHEEAARLRSTPSDVGTALDVAGNGRYARNVVAACRRERARRLHTRTPAELADLTGTDPGALIVSGEDMARALTAAAAGI